MMLVIDHKIGCWRNSWLKLVIAVGADQAALFPPRKRMMIPKNTDDLSAISATKKTKQSAHECPRQNTSRSKTTSTYAHAFTQRHGHRHWYPLQIERSKWYLNLLSLSTVKQAMRFFSGECLCVKFVIDFKAAYLHADEKPFPGINSEVHVASVLTLSLWSISEQPTLMQTRNPFPPHVQYCT